MERRKRERERREMGLIYRVVWLGEREEKEEKDNAIVRGVCTASYYLHE